MSTKGLLTPAAFSVVGGALLLSAMATPTSDGPPLEGPAVAASPPPPAAWDYKVLPRHEIVEMAPGHHGEYILPKDLLGDLNGGLQALGDQGWELVAVEPYHTEGYVKWPAMYVIRRPK